MGIIVMWMESISIREERHKPSITVPVTLKYVKPGEAAYEGDYAKAFRLLASVGNLLKIRSAAKLVH